MRDMIDIAELKASQLIRALTRSDLSLEGTGYIEALAEQFHTTRQPFYRIWYYLRQDWPTGYNEVTLKFLKQAFARLKANELTCQQVLSCRRKYTDRLL